MVGHEIGAIALAAISGVVIVSMFSKGSAAGTVIYQSLAGFSSVLGAIGAPIAGGQQQQAA